MYYTTIASILSALEELIVRKAHLAPYYCLVASVTFRQPLAVKAKKEYRFLWTVDL